METKEKTRGIRKVAYFTDEDSARIEKVKARNGDRVIESDSAFIEFAVMREVERREKTKK